MQPYIYDLEYFLLNAPKGLILLDDYNAYYYYYSNGKFRVHETLDPYGYETSGGLFSAFNLASITADRIVELAPQTDTTLRTISHIEHLRASPNRLFKVVTLHTRIRRH